MTEQELMARAFAPMLDAMAKAGELAEGKNPQLYFLAVRNANEMEVLKVRLSELPTLHEQWNIIEVKTEGPDLLPRMVKK